MTVAALLLGTVTFGYPHSAFGDFAEDIYDEIEADDDSLDADVVFGSEDIVPCDEAAGSQHPCVLEESASGPFREIPGDPTYDDVDVTPRTGRQSPENPYSANKEPAGAMDASFDDEPLLEEPSDRGTGGPSKSPGENDGSGGEYNYTPGYGPCQVLKGRTCYTLPNPRDEIDSTTGSETQRDPAPTGRLPDQSRNINTQQTNSTVPSPFRGGSPFIEGGSPFRSTTSARGLKSFGEDSLARGRAGSPNTDASIPAACVDELQAAGAEFAACGRRSSSQEGICGITNSAARCGRALIDRVRYSSCPAHVKQENIAAVQSVTQQFDTTASQACSDR